MTARHWIRFHAVSAGGVVVQMVALAVLAPLVAPHYLAATALAVEAAVLHNFYWHRRWTWADRPGISTARALSLLIRFNMTTGASSIAANLVLMRLLVGEAGLHPLAANLVAITSCSVVNFLVSDRCVFRPAQTL